MNEFKLKFGIINDSDSSSADYFLCPAAAENMRVPGFQLQSPDGLCAADEAKGTLEYRAPRPFAK